MSQIWGSDSIFSPLTNINQTIQFYYFKSETTKTTKKRNKQTRRRKKCSISFQKRRKIHTQVKKSQSDSSTKSRILRIDHPRCSTQSLWRAIRMALHPQRLRGFRLRGRAVSRSRSNPGRIPHERPWHQIFNPEWAIQSEYEYLFEHLQLPSRVLDALVAD